MMTRLGQPMTDDEVDEILRKGDINGDGKLNYTGQFSVSIVYVCLSISKLQTMKIRNSCIIYTNTITSKLT